MTLINALDVDDFLVGTDLLLSDNLIIGFVIDYEDYDTKWPPPIDMGSEA